MFARLLRALLLVCVLLPLGAASPPVFAQEASQADKARAIELIEDANAAYDNGDFRNSLRLYREVYSLTEDPRVLYRIALNYESLSNFQRAREHLELFLLAEPGSKYAGRVKAKIESLRELEANIQAAIVVDTVPSGAEVWLDDTQGPPVGVTPVRLPVGVGPVELHIRKQGYEPHQDELTVEAGETLQKTYELTPDGSTPPPVVEAPPEDDAEEGVVVATNARDIDATAFAGQPAHVRIGPSTGVAVLCWIAVSAGWVLAAVGVIGTQAAVPGGGAAAGVGLGLLGVGGYFLWFHDWTRSLPPATAATFAAPPARGAGFSVAF